ncbi:MAG: DUF2520 domain-containing protein [Acidobacteria bacterium]|nr:DUF2520 domain-containing protein [Acidobacteriota bacterium]
MRLGLVGPGRVGRGLVQLLPPQTFHVGPVLSRDFTSARRAVRLMQLGEATADLEDLKNCKIVLVTVPDQALDEVIAKLAQVQFRYQKKVVLHTSLARGSKALARLRLRGAATGSLQPLYGFQHPVLSLHGVHFSFEGSRVAAAPARRIVRALGGEFQLVKASQKAQHHHLVAHSMASDLMTGLLESAVRRMRLSGYTRKRAFQAISKLIELSVKDYAQSGRKSRPGPLLQNENRAAELFLKGLEGIDSETADDYIRCARQTLQVLRQDQKEGENGVEP